METDALNQLLADNLASLMDERGLNPSKWAKDAGLSHTAVRDILQKKVKNPTYGTLLKLAKVAGVDVQRITVGPHYQREREQNEEIIHLLLQLEPQERDFLLNAAKAQVAARDEAPE